MTRTPDGPQPRNRLIAMRFSKDEYATFEEQRAARGAPTTSAYIRRLIAEDARKIRREQNRAT